jgi:hypothetical protein
LGFTLFSIQLGAVDVWRAREGKIKSLAEESGKTHLAGIRNFRK